MYRLINGLLHDDGKPVFGVGVSYYASYHPRKVPVPPELDRFGEMRKDIKAMKNVGFNIVRYAALGDLSYDENGSVKYSSDLIDAMAKEADRVGIANMIRLQGYSSNLSGYSDSKMIDAKGNATDTSIWYNFIQDSLFHKGILMDNNAVTETLAKHFNNICHVACFQTYNEPHYPSPGLFDYHKNTIEAYRVWLIEKKIMSEDEAKNYYPPTSRPQKGEKADEWINWRIFSMRALSDFLGNCSDIAYNATGIETMTCLTTDPTNHSNAARGVSFYDSAERMNALGITHYYMDAIPEIFLACIDLDMAESASAIYRKPMWIVEYDARTDIPLEKFRRETYLALGSGCKGIMYYQWRGDYRYPDSPEGNGFGLINYDGTTTPNYDNAVRTVALINKLSDYFVNAEKKRCGVALLYSEYAFIYSDAIDNDGDKSVFFELKNRYYEEFVRMYKSMRRENISPDIIRAKDLVDNPLGVKVVYTASMDMLSEEEKGWLYDFAASGGKIITRNEKHRYMTGYVPLDYIQAKYNNDFEIYDTLNLCGVTADVELIGERDLLHQTLKGKDYYIICLTNASNTGKIARNTVLKINFEFSSAVIYTFEEQNGKQLLKHDNSIEIDVIRDGGIIILR